MEISPGFNPGNPITINRIRPGGAAERPAPLPGRIYVGAWVPVVLASLHHRLISASPPG
jgi:hypothetical protein